MSITIADILASKKLSASKAREYATIVENRQQSGVITIDEYISIVRHINAISNGALSR